MVPYSIKYLPHSQCQLVLTQVDPERYQRAEKKAFQDIGSGMRIKGFRPGHIPESIIRDYLEPGALALRTYEIAIPEEALEILRKENIRIAGAAQTAFESIDPLKVVMTFDVFPAVELGDYGKITVQVKERKATSDDVDSAISDLQKRMAEFVDANREAQKGDRVEIDFEGFTPDGVPLENTNSKNHPVVLGEGMLIPGFEDHVVGMKVADQKEFLITFPRDYHLKRMAGKEVKFIVRLNKVQDIVLPAIDDVFHEKVTGKKMTKEEFRTQVEAELSADYRRQYEREYEDAFFARLLEVWTVDPPQSMIDSEKENILRELKQQILYSGSSFERHLERLGKTEDELKGSYQDKARERVSLHLILQKIAEKQSFAASEQDIEQEITFRLDQLSEDRKERTRKNYEKGSAGYRMVQYQLVLRKVMDHLLPFKSQAL